MPSRPSSSSSTIASDQSNNFNKNNNTNSKFAVQSNFYSLANYNETNNNSPPGKNLYQPSPASSNHSVPSSPRSFSMSGSNYSKMFQNSHNNNQRSSHHHHSTNSPATTRPSTTDSKTGEHFFSSKTVRKKYPIGEAAQKTKDENKRELERILKITTPNDEDGVANNNIDNSNNDHTAYDKDDLDDLATDKVFKPRLPNTFFELTDTALSYERPPPPPSDDDVIDTSKQFGKNRPPTPPNQTDDFGNSKSNNNVSAADYFYEDEDEEPQLLVANEHFNLHPGSSGVRLSVSTPQSELKIPKPPSSSGRTMMTRNNSSVPNTNNNNQQRQQSKMTFMTENEEQDESDDEQRRRSIFCGGGGDDDTTYHNSNQQHRTSIFFKDQKETKKNQASFAASFRMHRKSTVAGGGLKNDIDTLLAKTRQSSIATTRNGSMYEGIGGRRKSRAASGKTDDEEIEEEPLSLTNAKFPGISEDGTRILPHHQVNGGVIIEKSSSDNNNKTDENATGEISQEESDIMITDCIYQSAEDMVVPSKGTKKIMQQFAMKPFAREMTVALFWTVVLKLQTSEHWIIEQEKIAKMGGDASTNLKNAQSYRVHQQHNQSSASLNPNVDYQNNTSTMTEDNDNNNNNNNLLQNQSSAFYNNNSAVGESLSPTFNQSTATAKPSFTSVPSFISVGGDESSAASGTHSRSNDNNNNNQNLLSSPLSPYDNIQRRQSTSQQKSFHFGDQQAYASMVFAKDESPRELRDQRLAQLNDAFHVAAMNYGRFFVSMIVFTQNYQEEEDDEDDESHDENDDGESDGDDENETNDDNDKNKQKNHRNNNNHNIKKSTIKTERPSDNLSTRRPASRDYFVNLLPLLLSRSAFFLITKSFGKQKDRNFINTAFKEEFAAIVTRWCGLTDFQDLRYVNAAKWRADKSGLLSEPTLTKFVQSDMEKEFDEIEEKTFKISEFQRTSLAQQQTNVKFKIPGENKEGGNNNNNKTAGQQRHSPLPGSSSLKQQQQHGGTSTATRSRNASFSSNAVAKERSLSMSQSSAEFSSNYSSSDRGSSTGESDNDDENGNNKSKSRSGTKNKSNLTGTQSKKATRRAKRRQLRRAQEATRPSKNCFVPQQIETSKWYEVGYGLGKRGQLTHERMLEYYEAMSRKIGQENENGDDVNNESDNNANNSASANSVLMSNSSIQFNFDGQQKTSSVKDRSHFRSSHNNKNLVHYHLLANSPFMVEFFVAVGISKTETVFQHCTTKSHPPALKNGNELTKLSSFDRRGLRATFAPSAITALEKAALVVQLDAADEADIEERNRRDTVLALRMRRTHECRVETARKALAWMYSRHHPKTQSLMMKAVADVRSAINLAVSAQRDAGESATVPQFNKIDLHGRRQKGLRIEDKSTKSAEAKKIVLSSLNNNNNKNANDKDDQKKEGMSPKFIPTGLDDEGDDAVNEKIRPNLLLASRLSSSKNNNKVNDDTNGGGGLTARHLTAMRKCKEVVTKADRTEVALPHVFRVQLRELIQQCKLLLKKMERKHIFSAAEMSLSTAREAIKFNQEASMALDQLYDMAMSDQPLTKAEETVNDAISTMMKKVKRENDLKIANKNKASSKKEKEKQQQRQKRFGGLQDDKDKDTSSPQQQPLEMPHFMESSFSPSRRQSVTNTTQHQPRRPSLGAAALTSSSSSSRPTGTTRPRGSSTVMFKFDQSSNNQNQNLTSGSAGGRRTRASSIASSVGGDREEHDQNENELLPALPEPEELLEMILTECAKNETMAQHQAGEQETQSGVLIKAAETTGLTKQMLEGLTMKQQQRLRRIVQKRKENKRDQKIRDRFASRGSRNDNDDDDTTDNNSMIVTDGLSDHQSYNKSTTSDMHSFSMMMSYRDAAGSDSINGNLSLAESRILEAEKERIAEEERQKKYFEDVLNEINSPYSEEHGEDHDDDEDGSRRTGGRKNTPTQQQSREKSSTYLRELSMLSTVSSSPDRNQLIMSHHHQQAFPMKTVSSQDDDDFFNEEDSNNNMNQSELLTMSRTDGGGNLDAMKKTFDANINSGGNRKNNSPPQEAEAQSSASSPSKFLPFLSITNPENIITARHHNDTSDDGNSNETLLSAIRERRQSLSSSNKNHQQQQQQGAPVQVSITPPRLDENQLQMSSSSHENSDVASDEANNSNNTETAENSNSIMPKALRPKKPNEHDDDNKQQTRRPSTVSIMDELFSTTPSAKKRLSVFSPSHHGHGRRLSRVSLKQKLQEEKERQAAQAQRVQQEQYMERVKSMRGVTGAILFMQDADKERKRQEQIQQSTMMMQSSMAMSLGNTSLTNALLSQIAKEDEKLAAEKPKMLQLTRSMRRPSTTSGYSSDYQNQHNSPRLGVSFRDADKESINATARTGSDLLSSPTMMNRTNSSKLLGSSLGSGGLLRSASRKMTTMLSSSHAMSTMMMPEANFGNASGNLNDEEEEEEEERRRRELARKRSPLVAKNKTTLKTTGQRPACMNRDL